MPEPASRSFADAPTVSTVSELNRSARVLVEERFNLVWVRGELSNLRKPGSGHWYFTLKDEGAQIRCAMFAGRNRMVRFRPAEGSEITVRGRVTLFEPRGDFQIIVDAMEPTGEGALRAAFDALKTNLAREGLFDVDRKRALPVMPRRLAIVSSASGAALRDVLHVISRRFPGLAVMLLPVAVQGDSAEPQVLRAFEQLAALPDSAPELAPDAVLLTRGGGSMEDLWAFNSEAIARAIAACPFPVVSAIGHEVDVTIADFVADVRAPTPSAGAELITPDGAALAAAVADRRSRLQRAYAQGLARRQERYRQTRRRLTHPSRRLEVRAQHLDGLSERLARAQRSTLTRTALQLQAPRAALKLLHPHTLIGAHARGVASLEKSLATAIAHRLSERAQQLAATARAMPRRQPAEHAVARLRNHHRTG